MLQSEVDEKIYDDRMSFDWSKINESDSTTHYSKDMVFNDGHRLSILIYSILFVISTIGNTTVLYLLVKKRLQGPSRIDIMLMHLAIADLLVTLLLMPLEIIWAYTVEWKSTDLICRMMSFFRVFGLYLSSFVMVCISVDRYFAILRPLQLHNKRGRVMLAYAWLSAVICSTPQAFLFHLEEHPVVKGYFQCVTFYSFASELHKLLYNIGTMCAMYACPLITFVYCYSAIYFEIYRKSKRIVKGVERFRRSNDDVLGRAKKRTLKMTITIVIVFIICWTPYYIICMWYWIDKSSVDKVSSLVRKCLFIFASTNSCMNPIVYGVFNIRGRVNYDMCPHNRHILFNRLDHANSNPRNSTNLKRSTQEVSDLTALANISAVETVTLEVPRASPSPTTQ